MAKYTLHTMLLPVAIIAALQLGGCTRDIAPAPPGGTYRSESAGASFEQSVDILGTPGEYIASLPLREIFRSPANPDEIYVAAGSRGIVTSADDGQTWQIIPTPLTSTLDIVALPSGILVASGSDGSGQGFVIRSLDSGKSWQSVLTVPIPVSKDRLEIIKSNTDVVASVVLSIEPDPFNPDRIYAGSNLGTVFVGEQSAKTWRSLYTVQVENFDPLAKRQQAIKEIIPSPHREGEILIVNETQELIRISPGLQAEIKVPEYIDTPPPFGAGSGKRQVFAAAYIKEFPDALIIGVEDGAVVTRDRGASWVRLNIPVESTQAFNSIHVTVSPTNVNRILVAINNVIYRSEDGGNSWSTFALGLPNHIITDLSINPGNASKVLLVTTPVKT